MPQSSKVQIEILLLQVMDNVYVTLPSHIDQLDCDIYPLIAAYVYAMFFVFDTVIISVRRGCVLFVSHEGGSGGIFLGIFMLFLTLMMTDAFHWLTSIICTAFMLCMCEYESRWRRFQRARSSVE